MKAIDDEKSVTELESKREHISTKPKLLVRNDNLTPPLFKKLPKFELKPLPNHLRYTFLREDNILPIIISNKLSIE